jgi:NADPH:quinone reductase-like Zn-dependent oxidoreductase
VLSPFISQRLTIFLGVVRAAELQDLAPLIDAGKIAPALDRTFALVEAQDAIRFLENGQVSGKVVLTI